MRKLLSFSALKLLTGSILVLFTVSGCKKAETDTVKNNPANKILAYLESEKISGTNSANFANRNANIDLLKENLEFTAATTEYLDNKLDLLVVPIKDEVINKKNLDKNSTLTLILITDKDGKISSGSIVYFQPRDGKKHSSLPQNTFSNMFSRKAVAVDGVYKMLTLTGRWISQYEIKDGKLASTGTVQQKDKNKSTRDARTTQCWNWYLVITWYWSDGTITQTSEYLGTTCDDCDSGMYQSLCPEGGGGNGGGVGGGIETGQDETTGTRSETIPESSPGSGTNGGIIGITWHALCAWSYNHTDRQFNYISPYMPFAIPISQPFTDDNGNSGILTVSVGAWSATQTPLTFKSVFVQWSFIAIWNYLFVNGPRIFTFNDGISKVIGPL